MYTANHHVANVNVLSRIFNLALLSAGHSKLTQSNVDAIVMRAAKGRENPYLSTSRREHTFISDIELIILERCR